MREAIQFSKEPMLLRVPKRINLDAGRKMVLFDYCCGVCYDRAMMPKRHNGRKRKHTI